MSPLELKNQLEALLGKKIELLLKDNRSVFLRIKKSFFSLKITLHKVFLEADEDDLAALKEWVTKKSSASQQHLRDFFNKRLLNRNYSHQLNLATLKTTGQHYNLQEIYDHLNQFYFQGALDLKITWRKAPVYRKHRRITFGSFSQALKLIRINSVLDNSKIPSYFVSFVVYHEILHHVYPIKIVKSRKRIHFRAFKEAEKKFLKYSEAEAFRKQFKKGKSYGWT